MDALEAKRTYIINILNGAGDPIEGCCCPGTNNDDDDADNPFVDTPDMTCACITLRRRYTISLPAFTTDFDTTGSGSCLGSLCAQFSGGAVVLEFIGGTEALMDAYLAGIYVGGANDYCGDGPNAANVSAALTDGADAYYYWAFAACYCGWDGGVGGETWGYHAVLSVRKDCSNATLEFHTGSWVNNAATGLQTARWRADLLGGFTDLTDIVGLCTGLGFTLTYDQETTFNPTCSLAGPLLDMDFTV